jgi:hypothetical protein
MVSSPGIGEADARFSNMISCEDYEFAVYGGGMMAEGMAEAGKNTGTVSAVLAPGDETAGRKSTVPAGGSAVMKKEKLQSGRIR